MTHFITQIKILLKVRRNKHVVGSQGGPSTAPPSMLPKRNVSDLTVFVRLLLSLKCWFLSGEKKG